MPVTQFEAHAWRARIALTPVAANKRRDKRGADLMATFFFILPTNSTGPFVNLERAEPSGPISEAEWRQTAFDMGAGPVASLLFSGRTVAYVVALGEDFTK